MSLKICRSLKFAITYHRLKIVSTKTIYLHGSSTSKTGNCIGNFFKWCENKYRAVQFHIEQKTDSMDKYYHNNLKITPTL